MKRCVFQFAKTFAVVALSIILINAAQVAAAEASRPNIVWIVCDDLGVELGCYGEKLVATPRVDGLAKEGVRFTRAFSTSPVCSASRSAYVTGMYQTSIGAHAHRPISIGPLPDGVKPVTSLFRDAGYFVCNMSAAPGKKRAKIDYNFTIPKGEKLFDGDDWAKRKKGQPFFAQVQIYEPHRTFVKDPKPGRADKVKLPPYYPDHPLARADWANYLATIEVMDKRVGAVLDRLEKEGLAGNTVVMLFGDHGRPHVRGKQWLYEGGIHTPLIVKLPTSMASVKLKDGAWGLGSADDRMVSLIDVAATSLSLAGIERPKPMHGIDFLAKGFKGRKLVFAARDRCGDAVDRIRCVRTERFKYIRNFEPTRPYMQMSGYKKLQYPVDTLLRVLHAEGKLTEAQAQFMAKTRPTEELYDLHADPHELNNLAGDPKHAKTLAALRGALEAWIKRTNDHGQRPEADEAAIAKHLASKRTGYYAKVMKRRKLSPDISDRDYLAWWAKELGLP